MRLGCIMLALALAAGSAVAQPVVTSDPDADLARQHFERALGLYDQGHFADAAREFEQARELKPLPAFDYNIARCYERLEQWGRAASEYQRYLSRAPNAPEAPELRARIPVLKERARQAALATAPPPATRPTPAPRSGRLRIAAWAVGALALAAAGAGTGAYLSVYSEYQDQRRTCLERGCTAADLAPLQSDVDRAEAAGYALWGLAGAAAIADVVLWTLSARERRPARVAVVPFGAGAAAVVSF